MHSKTCVLVLLFMVVRYVAWASLYPRPGVKDRQARCFVYPCFRQDWSMHTPMQAEGAAAAARIRAAAEAEAKAKAKAAASAKKSAVSSYRNGLVIEEIEDESTPSSKAQDSKQGGEIRSARGRGRGAMEYMLVI